MELQLILEKWRHHLSEVISNFQFIFKSILIRNPSLTSVIIVITLFSLLGLLVSFKEVFIVAGMVLGYSVGYAVSTIEGGWRYTYGCSIPFALLMLLGMTYLPYSARWLALKGRLTEARMSMKFVTANLSESEFEAVKEAAEKAALSASQDSFSDDYHRLTSPSVFPALVAGVGLVFFQQVTGQPSVLYYADSLFEDVGLSTFASILVSLFKLIATLVATFTVDSQGRKLLLYVGCSLMLIALVALGTAFLFPYSSSTECNTFVSDDTCISTCVWNTATCGVSTCVDAGKFIAVFIRYVYPSVKLVSIYYLFLLFISLYLH